MSNLHVAEDFGLIDHIRALDERVGKLEMAVFPPPPETQGSGTERYYGDAGDWTESEGQGLTDNTDKPLESAD